MQTESKQISCPIFHFLHNIKVTSFSVKKLDDMQKIHSVMLCLVASQIHRPPGKAATYFVKKCLWEV